jgi:hypothetical protein
LSTSKSEPTAGKGTLAEKWWARNEATEFFTCHFSAIRGRAKLKPLSTLYEYLGKASRVAQILRRPFLSPSSATSARTLASFAFQL